MCDFDGLGRCEEYGAANDIAGIVAMLRVLLVEFNAKVLYPAGLLREAKRARDATKRTATSRALLGRQRCFGHRMTMVMMGRNGGCFQSISSLVSMDQPRARGGAAQRAWSSKGLAATMGGSSQAGQREAVLEQSRQYWHIQSTARGTLVEGTWIDDGCLCRWWDC